MKRYADGASVDMKYLVTHYMTSSNTDQHVLQFFCKAREESIPVNGHMLKQEALRTLLKNRSKASEQIWPIITIGVHVVFGETLVLRNNAHRKQ